MNFSELGLQVAELHEEVLNLVDQQVEKVIIKATSNEGFISGLKATVTITSTGRTYDTPMIVDSGFGVAEIFIEYGLAYSVSVQSYQGVSPTAQSFTADRSKRDVMFDYDCDMAPLGVWIQTTDNDLIAATDWATEGEGKTARGVALITADNSFLIALTNTTVSPAAWGGTNTVIADIQDITQQYLAIADFDFKNKTDDIIAALNPGFDGEALIDAKTSGHSDSDTITYVGTTVTTVGAPAAEACRLYSSADMEAGSWSLPTLGCLYLMYLNKAAINACLTAVDGATTLANDAYWSSTESSAASAWLLNFTNGNQSNNNKYNSYSARGVAAFQSN